MHACANMYVNREFTATFTLIFNESFIIQAIFKLLAAKSQRSAAVMAVYGFLFKADGDNDQISVAKTLFKN